MTCALYSRDCLETLLGHLLPSNEELGTLFFPTYRKVNNIKNSEAKATDLKIASEFKKRSQKLEYLTENNEATIAKLLRVYGEDALNDILCQRDDTEEVLETISSLGGELYIDMEEASIAFEEKNRNDEQTNFFIQCGDIFMTCYYFIKEYLPDLKSNVSKKAKHAPLEHAFLGLGSLTWISDYAQEKRDLIFSPDELNKLKTAIKNMEKLKKILDPEIHVILYGEH